MDEVVGGMNLSRTYPNAVAALQNISDGGVVQFKTIAFRLNVKNNQKHSAHYMIEKSKYK